MVNRILTGCLSEAENLVILFFDVVTGMPSRKSSRRVSSLERDLDIQRSKCGLLEVINWQEEQEGACLVITAIPGVPAADLSGADLLKAWPSMGRRSLALFTAYRLINVRL
ncbi:hypothetical protein VEV11M_43860 (plasmid) [Escherichia coli]|nr:hypothetical protein VEV11M_43860 [Escherichia coli]